MTSIIAAVLFGLALLLELIEKSFGLINPITLATAGLLFLALHLAGVATSRPRARRFRR